MNPERRRGYTHRYDLGDISIVRESPAMIDDCPPGHLAPMQLAERTVVGAHLADRDGSAAGDAAFAAPIGALREHRNPCHLAHSPPDHAEYLTRLDDTAAAGTAISEARDITGRLRRRPLLGRAAGLDSIEPRIGARW